MKKLLLIALITLTGMTAGLTAITLREVNRTICMTNCAEISDTSQKLECEAKCP